MGLRRRLVFLAVIALLTASLAGAEKPLAQPTTLIFSKADLELLRQTDAFDKVIQERGWIYDDPQLNAYLEKLGTALIPPVTPENVKWRFRAIRDLQANAFALPNGSVYVTSGLLARMENEAQLAGVLGHEITHVVYRHSYLENRSSRKKAVTAEVILAGICAADPVGMGSTIVTILANTLPSIAVASVYGYSRQLERESDASSVQMLASRGYDLREFARGISLLRSGPEVRLNKETVFWASHRSLDSRVVYVSEEAALLQPNREGLTVNPTDFRTATADAARHNSELAITMGRPRTALATAQRLVEDEPNNPANYALLGDAYRALGARTPRPEPAEETGEGKYIARERLRRMTLVEYDKALLADPHGAEHWQANAASSEVAFRKALELSPQNADAHRGLGFLYECMDKRDHALEEFQKYLEMAPDAKDSRQVRMHLERLKESASADSGEPTADKAR